MNKEELTKIIKLGEDCGLTFCNEVDEDGLPVFVGEEKSWQKFNEKI